jgi:hypothetical protein
MILGALSDAGGQAYLAGPAKNNPAAFMTLLGKVLPLKVGDADGGKVVVRLINYGTKGCNDTLDRYVTHDELACGRPDR